MTDEQLEQDKQALRAENRALAVTVIANAFDHPSLYMGGPSRQALRAAEHAVGNLEYQGFELGQRQLSAQ